MKFLDRLALKIFSLIIFVIVVAMILLFIGVISINDIVMDLIRFTDGPHSIEIIFGILGVLMIFAIKGLFFTSKPESKGKEGIILENASGKLVISKESLENLIASVTKEIPGTETVASRTIVDKNKNLIVFIYNPAIAYPPGFPSHTSSHFSFPLSLRRCSSPIRPFLLMGASSLSMIRHVFSNWGQTK